MTEEIENKFDFFVMKYAEGSNVFDELFEHQMNKLLENIKLLDDCNKTIYTYCFFEKLLIKSHLINVKHCKIIFEKFKSMAETEEYKELANFDNMQPKNLRYKANMLTNTVRKQIILNNWPTTFSDSPHSNFSSSR